MSISSMSSRRYYPSFLRPSIAWEFLSNSHDANPDLFLNVATALLGLLIVYFAMMQRRSQSYTNSNIPPIRLINFETFKMLGKFPRYLDDDGNSAADADDEKLCVDISTVDRQDSLIVFISHNFDRNTTNTTNNTPHFTSNPDLENFKLCLEGIEKIMKHMAPGAKQCFVWHRNLGPVEELKHLDEIMKHSDCVFTPIYQEEGIYTAEFHASTLSEVGAWNSMVVSGYIRKAWCRLEMLYAACIPVADSGRANSCYQFGLKVHKMNGVRPHFIYGSSESKHLFNPVILPPLRFNYIDKADFSKGSNYDILDPLKGELSNDFDREMIAELYKNIRHYFKTLQPSYTGDRDSNGYMHGKGILRYASGDVYEGCFDMDKTAGKGSWRFANGDSYEGELINNEITGYGRYITSDGVIYDGQFKGGRKSGKGKEIYVYGNEVYDGDFEDGNLTGKGVYRWGDGCRYDGIFVSNARHGQGIFYWPNGNYFEGSFDSNKMVEGQLFLTDLGCKFTAAFSKGEEIVCGNRLYHVVLTSADGCIYREGDFSFGKFV